MLTLAKRSAPWVAVDASIATVHGKAATIDPDHAAVVAGQARGDSSQLAGEIRGWTRVAGQGTRPLMTSSLTTWDESRDPHPRPFSQGRRVCTPPLLAPPAARGRGGRGEGS